MQGRFNIGKNGMVFLGKWASRLVASLVKVGQLLQSVLVCVEVGGPHETQWRSLGNIHADIPWSPAQLAQHLH